MISSNCNPLIQYVKLLSSNLYTCYSLEGA
uniref:Uncharacterized protein n=1 Tax=Rhizophora mucronata TaxID=61149 RepID=A0A2P2PGH7_RHIMU